ncbi:type I-G CRISPR-associated protein Cas8g2 [Thalassoglobus polymorphus]|uniref:Uncharacterized protein n=1 Tax=Thalassoglobus polymorphus TaxID=2527994 RepID=A0A517QHL7_9PLAN|nr:type I-U CRISPR-associated protein Cas8c [Thalassoglobus polymorphus]QDT31133.1 hypothetical protein Mal48_03640 [Thalassoglobus polymorphus]
MTPEPTIRINVDVTNPGQFFACCGLLELADRLWNGAEGWFDESLLHFCIATEDSTANAEGLLQALINCELRNTMEPDKLERYEFLKTLTTKERSKSQAEERKQYDKLWRELPLVLDAPFHLTMDWFLDNRAGGSRFKTWAGQQSVINIALDMKKPVDAGKYADVPSEDWLQHTCGESVDFNFDSDSSVQSSPLDAGFSLDPLKMSGATRPLMQLFAFIGLQRFRSLADTKNNAYTYSPWTIPALPPAAACMASSGSQVPGQQKLTFPLLYRTKYLKSFLPAQLNGE